MAEPSSPDRPTWAGDAVHGYATLLRWTGSTAQGYRDYQRTHTVRAVPAVTELTLSSDPAFRGSLELLNPEQLLVAAASSCQLLSFLAVAARARLDVVAYTDETTAVMPESEAPIRITRIDIRPTVTLADTDRDRPTDERLAHLTEVAHKECFIANSLSSEVVVTPTFRWLGDAS